MLIVKIDLKSQQAFTLIELMIVVAIVGIIASIAYPSYTEMVEKSRRADAKGALLGFANAMERYFTENNSYCGAGTTDQGTCLSGSGAPTIFQTTSPIDGGTAFYNLTINTTVTSTSYTLTATRTGAQANDECGNLTIAQTGQRGISSADPGISVDDCW